VIVFPGKGRVCHPEQMSNGDLDGAPLPAPSVSRLTSSSAARRACFAHGAVWEMPLQVTTFGSRGTLSFFSRATTADPGS